MGWTRLLHHVREGDPFERPLTIHPTFYGDRMVDEPDLLDVNMLQTGHFGFHTLSTNADMIEEAVARKPRRPVVMSEACYEGIRATCFADVQRFMYWSSILSGAYGFTYGANGLWQVITRDDPYGASPHGQSWGRVTWQEAAELPGSTQVGLAARFLARYRWWELQPLPELLAYHQGPGNRIAPYAACIPGQVHLVFLPALAGSLMFDVARQRERDRAADPVDRRDPAMLAQAEAAYGGRVRMTGLEALRRLACVLLRSGHRGAGRDRRGNRGRARRLAVARPADLAGLGPRGRRPWRRSAPAVRARRGGRRCPRTRPRSAGR